MKIYRVMIRKDNKIIPYSEAKITKASAKREMLWAKYQGFDAFIKEEEEK